MDKIVKYAQILINILIWIVKNGIPFVRGIIEEIKAARAKKSVEKLD